MLGYIGDRAIVFHNSTAARVACANLVKVTTPANGTSPGHSH